MNIADEHAEEPATLARRYGVARLELFGSAATGEFNPKTSELDFLVEFQNPGRKASSTITSGCLAS